MGTCEELNGLLAGGDDYQAYKNNEMRVDHYGFHAAKQSPGWFDVRVFYVRVSSCASAETPELLSMRYPPRGIATALEVNGARIAPSEEVTVTLRRDRVDTDSSEVTYVSTANFRTSGTISFEVCYDGETLLRGSLERSRPASARPDYDCDYSVSTAAKTINLGWNMDCTCAIGHRGCVFLKGRPDPSFGSSPSSMEVCVVGRYSGSPVILTQTVQLTARRRPARRGALDVIPEGDESERSNNERGGILIGQEAAEKMGYGDNADRSVTGFETFYSDGSGYAESEDGELSWFNAGVRVGVGVGLGMCLGVGIGVGLMVRTYQATSRSLRRGLF